jgi:hypothetical protein
MQNAAPLFNMSPFGAFFGDTSLSIPHSPGGSTQRTNAWSVPYSGMKNKPGTSNYNITTDDKGNRSFVSDQELPASNGRISGVNMFSGQATVDYFGRPQVPANAFPGSPYQDDATYAILSGFANAKDRPSYAYLTGAQIKSNTSRVTEVIMVTPSNQNKSATGELKSGSGPFLSTDFNAPAPDCNNPTVFPSGTLTPGPDYIINANGGFEFGLLLSPLLRGQLGKLDGLFTTNFQFLPTRTIEDPFFSLLATTYTSDVSFPKPKASANINGEIAGVVTEAVFYSGKFLPARLGDVPDII